MKYVILVFMAFIDPSYAGWDNSVYITHEGDKPLVFMKEEECFKYAEKNQDNLFRFAYSMFGGDAIPSAMTCVPEDKKAGPGLNA